MNTPLDNDTADNVIQTALTMCDNIRKDFRWARGGNASARHKRILADLEDISHRFGTVMRAVSNGLINNARAEACALGM